MIHTNRDIVIFICPNVLFSVDFGLYCYYGATKSAVTLQYKHQTHFFYFLSKEITVFFSI